jgi:hypothetical protein
VLLDARYPLHTLLAACTLPVLSGLALGAPGARTAAGAVACAWLGVNAGRREGRAHARRVRPQDGTTADDACTFETFVRTMMSFQAQGYGRMAAGFVRDRRGREEG